LSGVIEADYQNFRFRATTPTMSGPPIDRFVGIPIVCNLVKNVLGYPEEKEAMYRLAVAG
jgi:hypothetical protein